MSIVIPFKPTQAVSYLQALSSKKPLVHCLTNDVVQNFTANVLLAIGATPAMVVAKEEVTAFTAVADGLLINIGTLTDSSATSMLLAAESARNNAISWVLDPVAVGPVLAYRTRIAFELLTFQPTVIRGNAAEILALAGEESCSRGPDSQNSTDSALQAAQQLARQYRTVVAVTGEIDYITDGQVTYSVTGGDIALTRITGAGCSLSAIVAAFVACSSDTLLATVSACFLMAQAGERADKHQGLGSFAVSLIDQLSLIDATQFQ